MEGQTDLILVTGFLGAGKTTLIARLLAMYRGERIHLIVNEFGRAAVDGALLAGLGASVDEIVNGSIFCACRLDEFESALDRAQAEGPDRIIVEASGLSDPTAIRYLLERDGRYPRIRYKGCVAAADAGRLMKVIDTARMCAKQLSVADLIALTKTDVAPPEAADSARALLARRYPLTPVVEVVKGDVPRAMIDALSAVRPAVEADDRRDLTLQKALVEISPDMTAAQLSAFLRLFAEDTCRIKGLVKLRDGSFLADCVGGYVSLAPYDGPGVDNRVAALAVAGMPLRRSLRAAVSWYEGLAALVRDD
ncbi:MAG: hypothetical protein J5602_04930 [Clostridia bacterium]|nr:hypothetical protein [Clostridia bacterium]